MRRQICCLQCSRLVHFKYSSMDVTVPGDLSVQSLATYLAALHWTFSSSLMSFCLWGSQTAKAYSNVVLDESFFVCYWASVSSVSAFSSLLTHLWIPTLACFHETSAIIEGVQLNWNMHALFCVVPSKSVLLKMISEMGVTKFHKFGCQYSYR